MPYAHNCIQSHKLPSGPAGLSDATSWSLDRSRTLSGGCCPDYVVIGTDGQTIDIACEKPFKFTFDSVNPVAEPKAKSSEQSGDSQGKECQKLVKSLLQYMMLNGCTTSGMHGNNCIACW